MAFKPLGNYVYILPLNYEEKKTSGGIILPESAIEQSVYVQKAKIIRVGPGDPDSEYQMVTKEGQTVIFNKHMGTKFIQHDKNNKPVTLVCIKEQDLLGYDDGEEDTLI